MIAHNTAREVLKVISVPTSKSKKASTQQKRIRTAAPRYMTEAQAVALKVAGEQGWVARSIVANAKEQRCAVSIQKGEEVAWIDYTGALRSEDDILKNAGAV
jgi:type III secretion system FlhB-like substrate exporter